MEYENNYYLFAGSRGTEYIVLFMQTHLNLKGLSAVYIGTNKTSSLKIISSRNLNQTMKFEIDKNINFTSYINITFPFDLVCHKLTTEYKAVIIRTTELSTVVLFDSYDSLLGDGTLVIPTNKLSTKYVVSTTEGYRSGSDYKSQFAIGVLHNKTQLNIKFNIRNNESIVVQGQTFSSGDVFSHTFGELETFHVSHTRDLTGTYITSNKPVAVFSGNRCNEFISGTGCSHLVSQLPPVDQYDIEYIIPPFYDNFGTVLQVLSPFQSIVNTSTGINISSLHLNDHEHKNIKVTTNEVTLIKSDRPVLVTAFAMGRTFYFSPYMTIIPGVHQYIDYYKVVVPDRYAENYLCIIFPTGAMDNLLINQLSVGQFSTVYQRSVVSWGKKFSVRTIRVQQGVYVIETTDQEPFGVIVFGHGWINSYGFAGNYVLF